MKNPSVCGATLGEKKHFFKKNGGNFKKID
jgi:hypothetical protein